MRKETLNLETIRENPKKPEHYKVKLTNKKDIKYLEEVRQNLNNSPKYSISELKVNLDSSEDGEYKVVAKNLAGVLQLPSGKRLQINPKIDSIKLVKMWVYTNLNHSIDYEETETILSQGDSYFDFLALILHKEIQKVFRNGLNKSYIRKKDEKKYLKGKLLLNNQINQIEKNKFSIEYEELSKDNLPNQILLEALSIARGVAKNDSIHRNLKTDLRQLRKAGVTRSEISESELDFETNRQNHYYEKALDISKHIITSTYYDEINIDNLEDSMSGYSILFNTYELFESYIRQALEESIPEEVIQGSQKFRESHNGSKINAEPDLLIGSNLQTDNDDLYIPDTVQAVGDIKYKGKPNNSNHYQAMAYGVINEVDAFLIYPSDVEKRALKYDINNSAKMNIEIPFPTQLLNRKDYLEATKIYLSEQIKEKLL